MNERVELDSEFMKQFVRLDCEDGQALMGPPLIDRDSPHFDEVYERVDAIAGIEVLVLRPQVVARGFFDIVQLVPDDAKGRE